MLASTSPSREKLRADIAVAIDTSESPPSKPGSPGGPLASKTFMTVILQQKMFASSVLILEPDNLKLAVMT